MYYKAGEPRRTVTFRLPVSVADDIKLIAACKGMSQADVISELLKSKRDFLSLMNK